MTTITKVGPKYQVTIPKELRDALGVRVGDFIEARREGRDIMFRQKIVLDKDHELEKDLEEAEEDIRAGRFIGPFTTAKAAMRALARRTNARRSR